MHAHVHAFTMYTYTYNKHTEIYSKCLKGIHRISHKGTEEKTKVHAQSCLLYKHPLRSVSYFSDMRDDMKEGENREKLLKVNLNK